MTKLELAKMIDHTLLKPDATEAQIRKLCDEAKAYHFCSVCVNSGRAALAKECLAGSDVKLCVLDIGHAKDGNWDAVEADIKAVRAACPGKVLKVILETCLLTEDEIVKACAASKNAGADFVKTSTGFSSGGAKAADVALMKKSAGGLKVKASGGIHSYEEAMEMIKAGADRIGASAGIAIVSGLEG